MEVQIPKKNVIKKQLPKQQKRVKNIRKTSAKAKPLAND